MNNYSGQLVCTLFQNMANKGFLYCVLHSYETLPEYASSDIDIAIDSEQKENLDSLISGIVSETGFSIIQKLHYDIPTCFYYVLANNNAKRILVVQLDFLMDSIGINKYCMTSSELLEEREKHKSFYVPSHGMQAVYLLIKKTIKDKFLEKHFMKLEELYLEKPLEVANIIDKYLGPQIREEVIEAIDNNSGQRLAGLIPDINSTLKKKYGSKRLLKLLWEIKRISFRVLNPTGLFMVVLSPDGGGKSSISKEALERLLGCFRKTQYLHWRPGMLPQIRTLLGRSKLDNEFVAANPHSPKRRSGITSFLRWMYYTIDYVVGYYLKILPMKIRTTAVIMDRYYYDIIVDPVRYGFNLPKWLLKLPLRFIPQPDLTIYLDNEPEELFKRKQELPVSELKRQVEDWRAFIPSLPNARIVSTDKLLEEVVHEVTKVVLERRAEMTRKMLKIEPEASQYLWKSESTDYIALPSKKDCRWIIPTNPKLAKQAWDLYQPYSFKGKIYKTYQKNLRRFFPHMKSKTIRIQDSGVSEAVKEIIVENLKRDDIVIALSTGTPSPFRKITGIVMSHNAEPLAYVKIGETPLAISRIKNEANMLKHIALSSWFIAHSLQQPSIMSHERSAINIRVPELLYEGEIGNAYVLIQSSTPFEGKSGEKYFNEDYGNILKALIKNTSVTKKFNESKFYIKLKRGVENYSLSYKEILKNGFDHLEKALGDKEIIFAFSHGDFAPWNMTWSKDKKEVFLYDWESANPEAPAGIDLIHLLFQTGFLLKKLRGDSLLNYIIRKPFLSVSSLPPEFLILIYCLHMAVTEDQPQQLNPSAVERRNIVKLIAHRS